MNNVLITGASSGIGFELTKIFAQNNNNIIMVSKNQERLDKAAEEIKKQYAVQIIPIAKDLAQLQSAEELYNELKTQNIQIDILINNAGFANIGNLVDTNIQAEKELIETNILTLTTLTKLFLKDMCDRNHGKILNTASVAAFFPGPYMATYYASKAYVLSFSEALAQEVKGTKVTISCLCPGPTTTGFQKRAGMKESRLFTMKKPMTAEAVAKTAYEGLMQGKRVIIPGFSNKLLAFVARLAPHSISNPIVEYVNH